MKTKDIGVALSKVLKLLPYSISTLPYDYALELARSYFKTYDIEIWSRNGHALRTLTPGASDLDLTVYTGTTGDHDYKKFICDYENLKKCMPFLGEVNWIDSGEAQNFKVFINPMEADRDPILRDVLGLYKKPTIVEKICFFLRCLASDTYGIRTNFSSRKRKWERHLIDLGFSDYTQQVSTPSEIFDLCEEKLLTENLPNYEKGFLGKIIKNHHQDINAWNRFYSASSVRDFLLLAPNRWLGATIHHNKMNEDLNLLSDLSTIEIDLLVAQIEWEIWGLFTQYQQIDDKQGLVNHLQNFKLLADKITGAPHLAHGFKKLIKLQI